MRFKQLDKNPREKHKKGLWSPDEDEKLRSYIHTHGVDCWNTVPINAGLLRNGKSCRLRWINYLRPGLKREKISIEEEEKIMRLHYRMGNRWSQMARCLPGRTDNEIKNHWHTNLKKRRGNKDIFITHTDANHKKFISVPEINPSSSFKTMSHESFGKTDEDQSSTELHKQDPISNFPNVFFTEWLLIDQTHVEIMQSSATSNLILHDQNKSNFQDSSVQSLLVDEEVLYGNHNCSTYGMFYPTLT